MKVMKCNNCKKNKYLKEGEKIDKCPYCKSTFIQIYENSENKSEDEISTLNRDIQIKGGLKMTKETKTDVRVSNAKKLIEYAKTLGIEDKEISKVLNRAYSIHRQNKN